MRSFFRCLSVLLLITIGYILGATHTLQPKMLRAQIGGVAPSKDTVGKISAAYSALRTAVDALKQDDRYRPATTGLHTWAVTVGGIDALDDLEKGRGVDPETFAALYAGFAIDDVAQYLGRNDKGQLTYKNKPVQMYPVSRLKGLFEQRIKYAGDAGAL